GMSSEGAEWLQIGRGYQSDVPDTHGGRRGKNSTSEVYIRNMLDAWLGLMTAHRIMAKRRKLKAKSSARRQRPGPARGPRATRRGAVSLDRENCERFLLHEAR